MGVTAALLESNGIKVFNQYQLEALKTKLQERPKMEIYYTVAGMTVNEQNIRLSEIFEFLNHFSYSCAPTKI